MAVVVVAGFAVAVVVVVVAGFVYPSQNESFELRIVTTLEGVRVSRPWGLFSLYLPLPVPFSFPTPFG